MPEGQYYIRVRGRVQGPFDVNQLHTMAKRGQFSRLHEVSSDGNSWARASDSPDLFPVCTISVTVSAPVQATSSGQDIPLAASPAPAAQVSGPAGAAPSQAEWYYARGGVQSGPHDFDTIKRLVASGQGRADDLAWSTGMASWQPIGQIPALTPAPAVALPVAVALPRQPRQNDGDESRTAGMAIAAVVLGMLAAALATGSVVLGVFVSPAVSIGGWLAANFLSVLTAIFGHSARKQIRCSPVRVTGDGLALTGLVMAYLVLGATGLTIFIFLAILFVAFIGGVSR